MHVLNKIILIYITLPMTIYYEGKFYYKTLCPSSRFLKIDALANTIDFIIYCIL
jgi:hypothetical protein